MDAFPGISSNILIGLLVDSISASLRRESIPSEVSRNSLMSGDETPTADVSEVQAAGGWVKRCLSLPNAIEILRHVGCTDSCRIWFQLDYFIFDHTCYYLLCWKFGIFKLFWGRKGVGCSDRSIRLLFSIQRPSLRHRRDHSDSARWKCPENQPRGLPLGTWPEQTRMISNKIIFHLWEPKVVENLKCGI